MSDERKARIANGLLVLASGFLACFVDIHFAWLAVFMGASLIFSGATGFCGFAAITMGLSGSDLLNRNSELAVDSRYS